MLKKPTLLDSSLCENSATLILKMDTDLEYFKGHFPTFSILPGVAQIELALRFAKDTLGLIGVFSGMEVIKFQDPIVPDAVVTLTLTWHAEKEKLHFSYQTEDATHSSGRILLGPKQNEHY